MQCLHTVQRMAQFLSRSGQTKPNDTELKKKNKNKLHQVCFEYVQAYDGALYQIFVVLKLFITKIGVGFLAKNIVQRTTKITQFRYSLVISPLRNTILQVFLRHTRPFLSKNITKLDLKQRNRHTVRNHLKLVFTYSRYTEITTFYDKDKLYFDSGALIPTRFEKG